MWGNPKRARSSPIIIIRGMHSRVGISSWDVRPETTCLSSEIWQWWWKLKLKFKLNSWIEFLKLGFWNFWYCWCCCWCCWYYRYWSWSRSITAGESRGSPDTPQTANEARDKNWHFRTNSTPATQQISKDNSCHDLVPKGHFRDAGKCEQDARILCSSSVQRFQAVCPSSDADEKWTLSYEDHGLILFRHVKTFALGQRGSSREFFPAGYRSFHSTSVSRSPASSQHPVVLAELPSGEKKNL